jgi:hypothetical protein
MLVDVEGERRRAVGPGRGASGSPGASRSEGVVRIDRSAPDRTARGRKTHQQSDLVRIRICGWVLAVPLDNPCPTPPGAVCEPSVSTPTRPGGRSWLSWPHRASGRTQHQARAALAPGRPRPGAPQRTPGWCCGRPRACSGPPPSSPPTSAYDCSPRAADVAVALARLTSHGKLDLRRPVRPPSRLQRPLHRPLPALARHPHEPGSTLCRQPPGAPSPRATPNAL